MVSLTSDAEDRENVFAYVWFFSFGFSRRLLGYLSQVIFDDVVSGFPHHTEVSVFPQDFWSCGFQGFPQSLQSDGPAMSVCSSRNMIGSPRPEV